MSAPPPPADRSQVVSPDHAGMRVDLLLARWLEVSRAEARSLLESGQVALDGRTLGRRDKGAALAAGSELRVAGFLPPAERRAAPARGAPLRVLAEGEGWLAIDKPAGMPVHPLEDDESETVLGHVASLHPLIHGVGEGGLRSGVVHRLDVDTSGALLLATEQASWERLRRAFSEQRVRKVYRAIVHGQLSGPERWLELPVRVAQHKPARVRVVEPGSPHDAAARPISMSVRPLEALTDATLVEVVPTTGFLHQIRVALAHVGHPLFGDRVYGSAEPAAAPRHMLHAAHVSFEEVAADCDPPADFGETLAALRVPASAP